MENKEFTPIPLDFSISHFQTFVVLIIIKVLYTLKDRDNDKFYTIEELYKLINKRAFMPYELNIHHIKDIIHKIEVYGFLCCKEINGEISYKIDELKADSLIND